MHPPRLSKGDTIGIVSPARWLAPDRIDAAAKRLEDAGFGVRIDAQNALRDGPFAGPDDARAAALRRLFADPEVKAVFCARGGYGSPRIADGLDYAAIAAAPKIFVGYSDMTCLLLSLWREAGLTAFHGPMLIDLAKSGDAGNFNHLIATLTGADPTPAAATLMAHARTVRAGAAEGPLIGGNLTLLTNMVGTRSAVDTTGAILFLEDVDEYLYALDRMFVHLKRAGWLDGLAGLILGSFSDLRDNDIPFERTVEEMAAEHARHRACPVVAGFPVGHGGANMTLPIGARARLEASGDGTVSFQLLETPVA